MVATTTTTITVQPLNKPQKKQQHREPRIFGEKLSTTFKKLSFSYAILYIFHYWKFQVAVDFSSRSRSLILNTFQVDSGYSILVIINEMVIWAH